MKAPSADVLFRVDASTEIGVGHFMRCLALADYLLTQNVGVTFVYACCPTTLLQRIAQHGIRSCLIDSKPGSIADAKATAEIAKEQAANWVVADGYRFSYPFQSYIVDAGLKLLVLDDYRHATHYAAHLILNQNAGVDQALYRNRNSKTEVLIGPQYLLLRREFLVGVKKRPRLRRARRLLVNFGGADFGSFSLKFLQALKKNPTFSMGTTLLLGPAVVDVVAIQKYANGILAPITIRYNSSDMERVLSQSDLALVSASSICWELAFMGVPALTLVTANNQANVAIAMHKLGVNQHMGRADECSFSLLLRQLEMRAEDKSWMRRVIQSGQQLVDGRGPERVFLKMCEIDQGGGV